MKRRGFLKTAFLGAAASASGCLNGITGGDGGDGDGNSGGNSGGNVNTDYSPCLYFSNSQRYGFSFMRVSKLLEEVGMESSSPLTITATGLKAEDVDELTVVQEGKEISNAVTADYSPSKAVNSLESENYEKQTDYSGYEIYSKRISSTTVHAVGVGDKHLLGGASSERGKAVENVRKLTDSNRGSTQRYYEEEQGFAELVNQLGDGTQVTGRVSGGRGYQNEFARGNGVAINGETTQNKLVIVFDSGEYAQNALGGIEANFEGSRGQSQQNQNRLFAHAENVNVERNGSAIVVTGSMPTSELSKIL
ncbi:MAG: hypothetical protein SXQ77_11235 [Halobacteria archaeon]|nr:hypothetical protein [Halobacteria archaeon]